MYSPKYTITNRLLANIAEIEASKALIENAALVPAWEARFQEDAVVRTVHYGTHLEGNELNLEEASAVVRDKRRRQSQERDVQEVINYRNVLKFLEEKERELKGKIKRLDNPLKKSEARREFYRPEILQTIHSLTVERLLAASQAGKYRHGSVVVRDEVTGKIIFSPPSALEVAYQLEDFFNWLKGEESLAVHPVIKAGIAHFEVVRIHPFLDGNGRAARALASFILFAEDYDMRKLFSMEEYFDSHIEEYYQALAKPEAEGDLTDWLEFFTKALSAELLKIRKRVEHLSRDLKLKGRLGEQVALSERQIKLMEYLQDFSQLTMSGAEKLLPMVSRDTILRDLRDLVVKGVIKTRGRTKGVVYLIR